MRPQVIMIRAIHTRAPIRARMRLLGTSKRKYPRKKMPAPRPYTVSLKPSADFIWSCANPILIRSRYAATYKTNRYGIRRRDTFRIVTTSSSRPSMAAAFTRHLTIAVCAVSIGVLCSDVKREVLIAVIRFCRRQRRLGRSDLRSSTRVRPRPRGEQPPPPAVTLNVYACSQ